MSLVLYKCDHCEGYFSEDDLVSVTINGRVGHIDNWLPDEYESYCPHCNATAEDSVEVTVSELVEYIDELKTELSNTKSKWRCLWAHVKRNNKSLADLWKEYEDMYLGEEA